MYIDKSLFSVVAVCEQCDWRASRATSAAAWTSLAIHVKAVHGETAAVGRVQQAASKARIRAMNSKDR